MSDFSARDDEFHFDIMSDRWWETETAWFSFCHPETGLGGWLYTMVRPNIGTVAGGAWIWDECAHLPWEVPYSANYTALRLPRDQSLTDIALPTGVSIRMLEPLTRYRLGFRDEGRLELDLEFRAVMPPRALRKGDSSFKNLNHFDQFGRVTGQIVLHGRPIDIDCYGMRDRSWGAAPRTPPRQKRLRHRHRFAGRGVPGGDQVERCRLSGRLRLHDPRRRDRRSRLGAADRRAGCRTGLGQPHRHRGEGRIRPAAAGGGRAAQRDHHQPPQLH
ncbi:hypothetical protein ACFSTD_17090 [Novosphingobium colocasiae]